MPETILVHRFRFAKNPLPLRSPIALSLPLLASNRTTIKQQTRGCHRPNSVGKSLHELPENRSLSHFNRCKESAVLAKNDCAECLQFVDEAHHNLAGRPCLIA